MTAIPVPPVIALHQLYSVPPTGRITDSGIRFGSLIILRKKKRREILKILFDFRLVTSYGWECLANMGNWEETVTYLFLDSGLVFSPVYPSNCVFRILITLLVF